jgi:hypothetical protein
MDAAAGPRRSSRLQLKYYDSIAHHSESRGDRIALIDLATHRHLSYRELDELGPLEEPCAGI